MGIRALKQNASAVVSRAAAGQSVTITDRGRAVAQLSPFPASPLQRLIDSGRVRPPRRALEALPAPEPGPGLTRALLAARAQDRP